MPAGLKNPVWLEFRPFPLGEPSEESTTPCFPIWSRSLLPSCEYFCTMPSPLPVSHTLLSASTAQPWGVFGVVSGSPNEFTTFPSGSNSITTGAWRPASRSLSVKSRRFKINTWSFESMDRPPIPPVTQRFGKGLGHAGSTSNLGALLCACNGAKHRIPMANISPADATAIRTKFAFFFILSLFAKSESAIVSELFACNLFILNATRMGILFMGRNGNTAGRLHVVFHNKHGVRLAVNVSRDVICLLRRQAVGLILRHVVLHKRRHLWYLIHARAVAVGIRAPQGRGHGKLSRTIRAMAYGALCGVNLAPLRGVSIQFRKFDEPPPRKPPPRCLFLGKPLRVLD